MIAAGDTVAINAVGIQITVEIRAVEIGAAVEGAAGTRPKKVMTEDHETTAKAVVTTVAAAALAWNTIATEPIDRLISSHRQQRNAKRAERKREYEAMADTLKALSAATNGGTAEKAAKRSAINNLTEKGKELFVLVCICQIFRRHKPKNECRRLDDDSGQEPIKKIAALLDEWTSSLKGNVSSNEFLMVLIKGWISQARPGGCTLFMRSPRDPTNDTSPCRKYHIRQVMGVDNISTDQVARLAKREIYLPDSVYAADSVRRVDHTRRQNDNQRRHIIRRIHTRTRLPQSTTRFLREAIPS